MDVTNQKNRYELKQRSLKIEFIVDYYPQREVFSFTALGW
ncbi:hypothetical protein LYNGBM3L_57540 [Moorena producens 3L]|uniref:Uncharacterized protein n=1 Tax=Moorena producens 3L TaxID=489825 RepID=F4XZH5_9CYAN|nr:hypothetical protein LYNGBM3L_57540 [Moorena producens 3L]